MNHLPPSLLGAKEQSQTQQNGRNWPTMLSLGGGGGAPPTGPIGGAPPQGGGGGGGPPYNGLYGRLHLKGVPFSDLEYVEG